MKLVSCLCPECLLRRAVDHGGFGHAPLEVPFRLPADVELALQLRDETERRAASRQSNARRTALFGRIPYTLAEIGE